MDIKYNSSQKEFLFLHFFVVLIVILSVIGIMEISEYFIFSYNHPHIRLIIILLIGLSLYLFLSNSITNTLFKKEKSVQDLLRRTLHELNTPVATILMNVKLLKKNEHNNNNLKRLNRINKASYALLELYEDMEYEIKAKINTLSSQKIDIAPIIINSIQKFEDIKDKIYIKNSVVSLIIITEKKGFGRMIDNLISNAIKYNKPNGDINIMFNSPFLIIEDSGIGISSENLLNIFDKYFQEEYRVQGFGLGLGMVKDFCDNNKIKIHIDSTENQGTKISLDLSRVLINHHPSNIHLFE